MKLVIIGIISCIAAVNAESHGDHGDDCSAERVACEQDTDCTAIKMGSKTATTMGAVGSGPGKTTTTTTAGSDAAGNWAALKAAAMFGGRRLEYQHDHDDHDDDEGKMSETQRDACQSNELCRQLMMCKEGADHELKSTGADHELKSTSADHGDKSSSGLRIKGARPSIQLGNNGDVKLTRTGDNQLQIDANVMLKNLMVDAITVDGVPLGSYVAKIIKEEMAKMGGGRATTWADMDTTATETEATTSADMDTTSTFVCDGFNAGAIFEGGGFFTIDGKAASCESVYVQMGQLVFDDWAANGGFTEKCCGGGDSAMDTTSTEAAATSTSTDMDSTSTEAVVFSDLFNTTMGMDTTSTEAAATFVCDGFNAGAIFEGGGFFTIDGKAASCESVYVQMGQSVFDDWAANGGFTEKCCGGGDSAMDTTSTEAAATTPPDMDSSSTEAVVFSDLFNTTMGMDTTATEAAATTPPDIGGL